MDRISNPNNRYIKELAERVNNLEYRTGAAAPEPQFSSMAAEQSYLPAIDPAGRKRPYDSSGGSDYYDHTYNQLSDSIPRHERAQPDTSIREPSSAEVRHTAGDGQPQSSNMNATEVHADLIHAYVTCSISYDP